MSSKTKAELALWWALSEGAQGVRNRRGQKSKAATDYKPRWQFEDWTGRLPVPPEDEEL